MVTGPLPNSNAMASGPTGLLNTKGGAFLPPRRGRSNRRYNPTRIAPATRAARGSILMMVCVCVCFCRILIIFGGTDFDGGGTVCVVFGRIGCSVVLRIDEKMVQKNM